MIDNGPPLPAELQTLTGIGKARLIELRALARLGRDPHDEPNIFGTGLEAQMEVLQRRANVELRGIRP